MGSTLRKLHPIVVAGLGIALAACAADPAERDREERSVLGPLAGAAVGVTAGEIAGSTAAEGAFGAIGALAGLAITPYLETRDYRYRDAALNQVADGKPGDTVKWTNPNTGHHGELTYIANNDNYTPATCRDLQSKVFSNAKVTTETMLVCKLDSGWFIKDSNVVDQQSAG